MNKEYYMEQNVEKKIIAFAGTAHSGKSAVWELLKSMARVPRDIGFVGEAATDIMNTTNLHPLINPIAFQEAVKILQYEREETQLRENKIVIADRGLADAYVFLDASDAENIVGCSVEALLDRYYAVFFFMPYLSGDHITDGNQQRYETSTEELLVQFEKSYAVWGRHKNMIPIPTFDTVEHRKDYVLSKLNQILDNAFQDGVA